MARRTAAPGAGRAKPRGDVPGVRLLRRHRSPHQLTSPRVQSWNVILERQIGSVWQASASYLGSYTDRIWGQVQLNPGVFLGLGPCTLDGVFYPTCTTAANLNHNP